MRPALYYPWVYLKGGAERMLVELMTRSRHDWTLYTNHFEADSTFPELSGLDVVQLGEVSVRRSLGDVSRAMVTLVTQRLDLARHDALLVVSEGLGNFVGTRSPVPTSCICLTPLKVVYDEVTRERFFRDGVRPVHRIAFAAYELVDRPTWKRYARVFTNSHEVRRRLLESRLVEPGRIEVAHHGVDTETWSPRGPRERFFLVPGRIMWQKNVELVLEAWNRFKADQPEIGFELVIAGMVDQKSRPYLQSLVAQARGRADVRFVVSPSDAELIRLYQRCWAVVFPPLNEDWGLVPLEAMACGKPVLATDRGGPRESVVDGETGFLRIDHPHAFAEAMRRLVDMSTPELDLMCAQARLRALDFPWSNFVNRIDNHVEDLAGARASEARRPARVTA